MITYFILLFIFLFLLLFIWSVLFSLLCYAKIDFHNKNVMIWGWAFFYFFLIFYIIDRFYGNVPKVNAVRPVAKVKSSVNKAGDGSRIEELTQQLSESKVYINKTQIIYFNSRHHYFHHIKSNLNFSANHRQLRKREGFLLWKIERYWSYVSRNWWKSIDTKDFRSSLCNWSK